MGINKLDKQKFKYCCENFSAYFAYYLMESLERHCLKDKSFLYLARIYKKSNFQKAYYYYIKYMRTNTDDINAAVEAAQFLTDNNKITLSANICEEQLKKNPNHISFMLIQCQNFIKTGEYNKTIEYAAKVLEIDTVNEFAHKFISESYFKLGKEEDLKNEIKKFNFNSNSASTVCHIKDVYLKAKNLELGLMALNTLMEPKLKENNKKVKIPKYIHKYYEHIWKGEDLTNKNLFIFSYYCGNGDYAMLARYIPILEKQAKKVIIEVSENLFDLYKYNFPNCNVIKEQYKEFTGYDYTYHHELLWNMQKDFETFPYSEGYLKADPKKIKKMKETGLFNTKKIKVGISYQSNKGESDIRAIDINKIIPILSNTDCQFYAITKDIRSDKAKEILQNYNVTDCFEYINDAHDLAAIMKNLDIIISIDSFPVHLSGALGIKSFLLLPYDSDCRWFNDTEKTAWYDSIKIFKQTKPNQWDDVVDKVVKELKILSEKI